MSRLAKNALLIPGNVKIDLQDSILAISGPQGKDELSIHHSINVIVDEDNSIRISLLEGKGQFRAMLGTTFRNISNILHGVVSGFEKKLELRGVGYRAKMQGSNIELSLGLSHPVIYSAPQDIKLGIEGKGNTIVVVRGVSKQQVGQVAADIRGFRPPEPYKGKGIRYEGEHVASKEVKKKQ